MVMKMLCFHLGRVYKLSGEQPGKPSCVKNKAQQVGLAWKSPCSGYLSPDFECSIMAFPQQQLDLITSESSDDHIKHDTTDVNVNPPSGDHGHRVMNSQEKTSRLIQRIMTFQFLHEQEILHHAVLTEINLTGRVVGKENRYQTVNREGKDLKVEAIRPGEWGKENQGKWCWEVEWVETRGHGRLKIPLLNAYNASKEQAGIPFGSSDEAVPPKVSLAVKLELIFLFRVV
ncbi:hypothetical protein Q9966_015459 [Columba livia]|nr:hypothetical protein Q9966_015459 [Columba livia]